MGLFDELQQKVCEHNVNESINTCKSLGEAHQGITKYIEPMSKKLGETLGQAMSEADISGDFSPAAKRKIIDKLWDGDKKASKIWGEQVGQGLKEKLVYPLLRDRLFKNRISKALYDYKTAKRPAEKMQSRRGKRLNSRLTFESALRKGGLDIDWIYDTRPPQKKEDIVWLADVSGSMGDTFAFISPVVDSLRELGLKQRFFLGDTGDSFVEVQEGVPFGYMLEKIGYGGTDIGAGIANVRKAVKTFKGKSLIVYTDTETASNFKDEVEKVARDGGKVLILNPRPTSAYDFSKNKRVKLFNNVPGVENIGGFVDALNHARRFVMGR